MGGMESVENEVDVDHSVDEKLSLSLKRAVSVK